MAGTNYYPPGYQQAVSALQSPTAGMTPFSRNAIDLDAGAANKRKIAVQDIGNGQQQQAFGKMMEMLNGMGSKFNSMMTNDMGGGAGGQMMAPPREAMGSSGVGDMSAITNATDNAQSAAFGKAKATAGSLGRSAVDTLSGEMADRGISGSGTEGRGLVSKLAEATNPLSDLNVAQTGEHATNARHAQDLGAQEKATQFSGDVAQRGQDVGMQTAQAAMAQQKKLAMMQMFQSAMSGLTGHMQVPGLQY